MADKIVHALFGTTNLLAVAFLTVAAVLTGCAGGVCLGCVLAPRRAGPRAWVAWLIAPAGGLFFAWRYGLL